jgi:hypothetical protein
MIDTRYQAIDGAAHAQDIVTALPGDSEALGTSRAAQVNTLEVWLEVSQ